MYNTSVNAVSFGSSTSIIATPKGANKLKQILSLSNGKYILLDTTEAHRYSNVNNDILAKAVKDGKKNFKITYRKRI